MSNLIDIKGRVAVVVGGTSGLGRTIALGLASEGAHTISTGRRESNVQDVTQEILSLGVRSLAHTCDVGSRASIDEFRDVVLDEFGKVDIVVYAAGRTFKQPTATVEEDAWTSLMDTNLNGALRTAQSFYEPLKRSAFGRLINIASLSSYTAFHQVAAYGTSKAALLALTRNLACEWAVDGIRVNAIVPGVFVTDLNRDLLNGTPRGQELLMRTPLKRFGDSTELVGAAVFLASDAVSFITGAAIPVDGGFLASGVNQ